MVRLACLLPLLLLALPARADCASGGLSVWPPVDAALPANGRVVLEGFGTTQAPVARIASLRPVLVSDSDRVPLEVVRVDVGQFEVTQAVLKPSQGLKPGKRYRLELEAQDAGVTLDARVLHQNKLAPVAWMVGAKDEAAPKWAKAPEAAGGEWVGYGCGPAIYGFIKVSAESQVQYRVEVRRADGAGPARTFRVAAKDGRLEVGHGMCGGPFKLEEGVRYSAAVTAVDAAGNESPAPGAPVTLVGPAPR